MQCGKKCLFTHFIHLFSLLSFLWFCLLLPSQCKRPLSPHHFEIMILSLEYWVFKSMYVPLNDKQQTTWTSNSWQQRRTKGGGWGVQTPPKFRRPSKIVPNSTRLWKLLKIAEFRMPTHQDVPKNGSKILKLPRFAIVLH